MSRPLVSVIIPVFNREDTIVTTIESVQYQTYKNLEIIVIDDGSTDNTYHLLENYGDEIKFFHQINSGVSSARNKGIRHCTGDIIMFLDSDDTWLPQKVERQVDLFSQLGENTFSCWCNLTLRQPDGTEEDALKEQDLDPEFNEGIWLNPLPFFSSRFLHFNQSIAIRRSVLPKIEGFDESLKVIEDMDFALQLAMLGSWGYIKEPLVVWNAGTPNSLTKSAYKQEIEMYRCMKKVYHKFLINKSISSFHVKMLLTYKYITSQMKFWAAVHSQSTFIYARVWAKFLKIFVRVSDSIFTRLPTYPGMQVAPVKAE